MLIGSCTPTLGIICIIIRWYKMRYSIVAWWCVFLWERVREMKHKQAMHGRNHRENRKSSPPFHEIPPGYEARLFCGCHFHLALSYSTLCQSSVTEPENLKTQVQHYQPQLLIRYFREISSSRIMTHNITNQMHVWEINCTFKSGM